MQEQVEKFDLDRVTNIENNIDAYGKKWEIARQNRQTSLLVAKPNPFREDFVCPKEMFGAWTSYDGLQERIKIYVTKSWDQADKAKVKAEREALATLEREAEAKIAATAADVVKAKALVKAKAVMKAKKIVAKKAKSKKSV